jgi:hypothetical protein
MDVFSKAESGIREGKPGEKHFAGLILALHPWLQSGTGSLRSPVLWFQWAGFLSTDMFHWRSRRFEDVSGDTLAGQGWQFHSNGE